MATQTEKLSYQNNPFVVATDGINLLFKKAKTVGILAIVLSALGLFSNIPSDYFTDTTGDTQKFSDENIQNFLQSIQPETWVFLGIVAVIMMLGFLVIGTFINGIFDYTAARLADNKTTTFNEAVKGVASRFFSYLWLRILLGIKILLWSLLFIIPGIIMATRYSLSGPSFFRHNLNADAAIDHSTTITKGAWLTTFGSFGLFNIITLGIMQAVLQPGTSAVLQRQFDTYHEAKLDKPAAHGLSWLVLGLVITFAILVLAIVLIILGAYLLANGFSEG